MQGRAVVEPASERRNSVPDPTAGGLQPFLSPQLPQRGELISFLLLLTVSSGFWLAVTKMQARGGAIVLAGSVAAAILALHFLLRRGPSAALPVIAYLAGIEPLIREYSSGIGFMFVEYLVIILALVTLLLHGTGRHRTAILLLAIYLLLEVIGAFAGEASPQRARAAIVLTAGRLAVLFIASRASWEPKVTHSTLFGFVIGSGSLAAIVLLNALTGAVNWGTQANFEVTGGLGPNQVGFLLTYGAFASMLLSDRIQTPLGSWLMMALLALHGVAGSLTFTRGSGIVLIAVIVFYSVLRVINNPRQAFRSIMLLGVVAVTAFAAVTVTDSRIVDRYQRKNLFTHRDHIAISGWEMFVRNPLGVGTGSFADTAAEGGVKGLRRGQMTGSHNELIRAVAEHGAAGGLIYGLFLLAALRQSMRGTARLERGIAVMCFLLAVAYEFHSGMKLMMQALWLALAFEAFRSWIPQLDTRGWMGATPARQPLSLTLGNPSPTAAPAEHRGTA